MISRKGLLGITATAVVVLVIGLLVSRAAVRVSGSSLSRLDSLQISGLVMRVRLKEAVASIRSHPRDFIGIVTQTMRTRVELESVDPQRVIAHPPSDIGLRLVLPPGMLGCSDILFVRAGDGWKIGGMYGGLYSSPSLP